MIWTKNQDVLATWLCSRIGLTPSSDIRCIGRLSGDGRRILAVIGYDGWNGASCQMHMAGEGNWISRDLLYAVFDYPFNKGKLNMVIGMVPSGNDRAIRLNLHFGFRIEHEIAGAHPDGSLIMMTMRRAECRWIKERTHGQKERTSTST